MRAYDEERDKKSHKKDKDKKSSKKWSATLTVKGTIFYLSFLYIIINKYFIVFLYFVIFNSLIKIYIKYIIQAKKQFY